MPARLLKGTLGKSSHVWMWLGMSNQEYVDITMKITMQGNSCISSWDIDDQKTLQSYWMRGFWCVTCEAEFSQTLGWYSDKEICKIFRFKLILAKVKMDENSV